MEEERARAVSTVEAAVAEVVETQRKRAREEAATGERFRGDGRAERKRAGDHRAIASVGDVSERCGRRVGLRVRAAREES